MNIPVLDEKQVFENFLARKNSTTEHYYAFYSSYFGGIVKNPKLILLPIDDHMVHRGDGVFEAMKAADQNDVTIRIFISRGPGNFSVDPYKTIGSQVYLTITELITPSEEKYRQRPPF